MKKKMVIHSTSLKVRWTLCALLGVVLPVVEEHEHRGAAHRDGGRLEMQRPGEDEGDDDGGKDDERLFEQRPILDRSRGVHAHHPRRRRVRLQVPPPEQMDHQRLRRHDDDDDRRQVDAKALKSRPASEPIRMLGGSPISVAVPPMFDENTSANRKG